MPVYPQNPTYISGFHNNKIVNGKNDREYSALDIREPYRSVFSNGVKPNDDGTLGSDLQVQLVDGMQIRVAAGRGIFGGAFFLNKSAYNITLDTASASTRYDCVIVQNDDTENVRDTIIYVKSLNHIPTISDLKRQGDDINEYCLGYVEIPALATSISKDKVFDTRIDQNLCGVITGVFNQVDGAALNKRFEDAFNAWFDDIKNAFVAGATLIHTYANSVASTIVGQTEVEIGIPQYNMNTDVLIVSVNGVVFARGTQYEIVDNSKVRFVLGFPVIGTQVLFQVLKSVDGSQAESVVSQVETLINQMNGVNQKLEFDYYCNGVNDNIQISNIARTFRTNTNIDAEASLYITLHGNFGFSSMAKAPNWIDLGFTEIDAKRQITLDFKYCSKINLTLNAGVENNIFYGVNYVVKNLNLYAVSLVSKTDCCIHGSLAGGISTENCKVELITTGYAVYACEGFHLNNKVMMSSADNYASCFYSGLNYKHIVVVGGTYRSYTASSLENSHCEVFYTTSDGTNSIIEAFGVNCPTIARTNFIQKHCARIRHGYFTSVGLISAISNSIENTATSSITGTIPISKV